MLSSAYRMVAEIIQSIDVQIMNFHLKSNSNWIVTLRELLELENYLITLNISVTGPAANWILGYLIRDYSIFQIFAHP